MKSFTPIMAVVLFALPLKANSISACEYSCFKQKYQCNIDKSYTVNNTCHNELLSCKENCEGQKNHNVSARAFPIDGSI